MEARGRDRARGLYEGDGILIGDIAEAMGVTPSTVRRWARLGGWQRGERPIPRRRKADAETDTDRGAMVRRLMLAFARQVAEVEARLGPAGKPAGERDARTLGVLAKTLETLIELDRAARAGDGGGDEAGKDADAVREDIARRIDRLRGAR
ncbi:hypothetical protein SAMN02745172_02875 [Pseudoxanthobacter soli DSM 19599]|uniref:Homeodomain-like domain-containing protein n=1 Tax=Pseudoxanthobacter soli DSM 19599 TaxID=1123029 RepID=A0A1M7ZMU2_9HYPH|nr:hypothetical protein [Pseudoxanthobacter soli]SHO66220.1 hypothetical protein SAMN02745172_02875 [Pseudoxanthobacter soli DSM 19599]